MAYAPCGVGRRLRLDGRGRAEALRELELVWAHVHRDDLACTDDARGLDHGEPDAPAADDGDAGPWLDAGGPSHPSPAREHRAADQRSQVERHVLADRHRDRLGHDGMLGERGDGVEMAQVRPVEREPRGAVRKRSRRGHPGALLAEVRPPGTAALALAARGHEREHDVVAGSHALDAGPDLGHDAGRLVTDHERQRLRQVAVDDVQVAVADPAGRDPHEHLPALRRRQLDLEDLDGATRLPQHGGLHPHPGEPTAPRGALVFHRARVAAAVESRACAPPCSARSDSL